MSILNPEIEKLLQETAKRTIEGFSPRLQTLRDENEQLRLELETAQKLLQEVRVEVQPRPKIHQHSPDEPSPVIDFDFNQTLTPGREYPILEEPFPKVKEVLDRLAGMGCCLHVTTSGLYYASQEDLDMYMARLMMLDAWEQLHGLPISLNLPKMPADVYYDDRMIFVPSKPDWGEIGEQIEAMLAPRFDLVNGRWDRKKKIRTGTEIEEFPDIEDYPRDHPRGLSGARLDVDLHRTTSTASSSLRNGPPSPGAFENLKKLYDLGVTIHMSCAGWNPKTHSVKEWKQRLAGLRFWLEANSLPYDTLVTKDHGDVYVDDKGFPFTNWKADTAKLIKRLPLKQTLRPLHR